MLAVSPAHGNDRGGRTQAFYFDLVAYPKEHRDAGIAVHAGDVDVAALAEN
jgi:ABC-type phosphate/phosphonate transport system substrate-binding protein